jgi:SAM-dependent methyltransferase
MPNFALRIRKPCSHGSQLCHPTGRWPGIALREADRRLRGWPRIFTGVVATDASQAQITAALPHARVEYRIAAAEASGLPDASVDLIAVAQALHWFELDRFYDEARRVLAPNGAIAVWCYGLLSMGERRLDDVIQRFYAETLGAYWPPERRLIETGYRTLPFPFEEFTPAPFRMETRWTLPELLGYFRSWSATGRFIADKRRDPVDDLTRQLGPPWGEPERRRLVSWPLSLRVGRKSKADASAPG